MEVQSVSEIEHLHRIETFISSMSDLDPLLTAIVQETSDSLAAASASLALYDKESDDLYFYTARRAQEERRYETDLRGIRMDMGRPIIELIILVLTRRIPPDTQQYRM